MIVTNGQALVNGTILSLSFSFLLSQLEQPRSRFSPKLYGLELSVTPATIPAMRVCAIKN